MLTHCIGENPWLHMDWILPLRKACKSIFPVAEYAWTSIPTYPSGAMGFMVCGKSASSDLRKPARTWSTEEEDKHFKYYSKEVHEAAFKLPKFAEKALR
jgi:spermidine synthase